MNLMGRGPLGLKQPKPKKDKAYMAKVAELGCVICSRHPVEVHHCICDRYSQRKVSDTETIPLCYLCHSDLHSNKAAWRDKNGPDYDFIPIVQKLIGEDT
jgi:hypothetical protein